MGRSTLVLTGSAFIIQMIGLARQLFLAAEVGITSGLDALLIALAAPALVGILTAGVRTAMVPAYLEAKDERGGYVARRLAGAVLVWTGIAGVIISLALWVLADAFIAVTGPGLAAAGTADDAVGYLRTLAPLAFLMAVTNILYGLCQAESLFPTIALADVAGSVLTLGIMIAAWDTLALEGFVVGTLVGAVVSLCIVIIATVTRRVAPVIGLIPRGLGLRNLLRHAAPLSVSAAILQVSQIFDRAIASWLAQGGVSALRYGESIVRLPFAAISPAWSQAVYPALVHAHRGSTGTDLADMTQRMLRYALAFFVPLAWLTAAVAPIAVATAYDRGAFSGADLALTAEVVAVSAPLIVMWTAAPTLISALNARKLGTVMLLAGVINVALALVLDVVLGYLFGVIGIALATTLSTAVVVLFFLYRLARVEPTFSPRQVGVTFIRASLAILPAALVFGIPVWAGVFEGGLIERIVILVVVGVAGLSSYYVLARRLGLEEVVALVAFAKDTLRWLLARVKPGA